MNDIDKTSNRLEMIARRQRSSRMVDLLFTCLVMLASVIGGSTVGTALHGMSTHVAQH